MKTGLPHRWFSAILAAFFALPALVPAEAVAAVTFDDTSDPIVLSTSTYEIGFSADDGAITFIRDLVTGMDVSAGNSLGDLWRVKFRASGLLRSATFGAATASRLFTYSWDGAQNRLTLDYAFNESGKVLGLTVLVDAADGNTLDLSVSIDNQYGDVIDIVYVPTELSFDMNQVDQFYFPYYEGVAFQRGFFQELRSTFQPYQHIFADFGALESTAGNLALYAMPDTVFHAATIGLGYSSWNGGMSVYHHMFQTYIDDGALWSAPMLRMVIGKTIDQTMALFRSDKGWDDSPSLQDRVGTLFEPLSNSFLVKLDVQHVNDWGWASAGQSAFSWVDSVSALLPNTALLHLVSFWPVGFDNYYPDYLPPNTAYGTQGEFLSILTNAKARGQLVMPYTNPTWWDENSPTMLSLGTGIAADNLQGNPLYECYGANCGYVVSPSDPAVQQRQVQTVQDFTTAYPVDLLFEDQVADRPWTYDTNPAAADYVSYTDALVDNVKNRCQAIPLATEGMLDVLVGSETGFFDSVMLDKKAGWVSAWGDNNWVVYPITMLAAHDKAVFHQHNLAVEVMTDNKEMLTYNLSYGFGLNFDLTDQGGMLASDWIGIDAAFQRSVAARFTGRKMTSFEYLDGAKKVSRSWFEDLEVVGNHDAVNSYGYLDHTLVPQGLYAATVDGRMIAGVFSRFNGLALPGEHYLIQEKMGASSYRIEQPSGPDATIRFHRPSWWSLKNRIRVQGITESGAIVDVTSLPTTTIQANSIDFLWQRDQGGEKVSYYQLRYLRKQGGDDFQTGVTASDPAPATRLFVGASPNPFNPMTTIRFGLPEAADISLDVFDASGRLVKHLARGAYGAGSYEVTWNGTDDAGRQAASGIYFTRLTAGTRRTTGRVVLVR